MKKIKVAWFCSLNPGKLTSENDYFYNKKTFIISPWIDLSITQFRLRNDITLHIYSIDKNLKKDINIEDGNISFHFISNKVPIINKPFPYFLNFLISFFFLKIKMKKIIKTLNPDIIDCHGTDQIFSTVINSINKPTIITLSCFMMDLINSNKSLYNKCRFFIEKKVIKTQNNYGIRANFMKSNILRFSKKANFFWYNYPIYKPQIGNTVEQKKYDIAFFARLEKNKGIEDFIEVIRLLKKDFADVKAIIIGGANQQYLEKIKLLILEKNVTENIEFTGFLPSINDVYEKLSTAKIYLLPTYFDMIPGTLIEAMYLKIPSISYNVGGISDLNVNRESVILVEAFDMNQLALKCKYLLQNNNLAIELGINGHRTVNENYYLKNPIEDMINAYHQIIEKG